MSVLDTTRTRALPPVPPSTCARAGVDGCLGVSEGRKADPIFVLHLRPLPSTMPATIRLRRLLKLALRSFNFRCTEVIEVSDLLADSESNEQKGIAKARRRARMSRGAV